MTIDLSTTDPRNYLSEIERALCHAGRTAIAEALHVAHPRDLCEVWPLLPEDVTLHLWEVSDATLNHA